MPRMALVVVVLNLLLCVILCDKKEFIINLKSATPFPKCYLHKEKWTFDS